MNFLESLKGAFQNLQGNKVRSFLTMLGIIIGIASVITMSGIGKGGQEHITGDLKKGGYGKFTVTVDKDDEEFRWKYLLNHDLVEELEKSEKFKNVSVNISRRVFMKFKKRYQMINLVATTPKYEKIDEVEYIVGRGFLPYEYTSGEKIIVIDNVTAKHLFSSELNALGKNISFISGRKSSPITYKIVGVFRNPLEKLIKVMAGPRVPRFMRIPLDTYDRVYDLSSGGFNSIILESKNPENLSLDMKIANEILEKITGIKNLYQVETITTGASSFDDILNTMNIFVTFVAGISLLVGGIGVMNIMLVSVIERTKEIGIRKALGARNKDILTQFLMESMILTGLGGIIGIVLGIVFGITIGHFIGIDPIFSINSIILSMGISTLIGVIFGVTPANKASKLNPIDALRSE